MFYQYGSVLCLSCRSSMRLVTIVPADVGVTELTFTCRYAPCGSSRVFVIRKPRRGLDVPIEVAAVHPVHTVVSGETAARRPERWKSKTRPPSRAVTFSVKVVTL